MRLSYLPSKSKTDSLCAQLVTKRNEYNKAMKQDKEFEYIKILYLEIKELERKYKLVFRSQSTSKAALTFTRLKARMFSGRQ